MQGMQEIRVRSLVGKIPRSRNWQPTPVFLPGKFHGQRSLEGYSHGAQRVGHDWAHGLSFPFCFLSETRFLTESPTSGGLHSLPPLPLSLVRSGSAPRFASLLWPRSAPPHPPALTLPGSLEHRMAVPGASFLVLALFGQVRQCSLLRSPLWRPSWLWALCPHWPPVYTIHQQPDHLPCIQAVSAPPPHLHNHVPKPGYASQGAPGAF